MKTLSLAVVLSCVSLLAGCAGGSGGVGGGSAATAAAENAVTHAVTEADLAYVKSTEPIKADRVLLYVNGMGCPQCVTNVDIQLARLKGVRSSRVDLGKGVVEVELYNKGQPSPAQLAKAVAGDFTLVKIQEVK